MNELETLTLRLIGESVSDPDVFTDDSTGMAQIRASLNDAIEEISMINGGYKKNYHLPLRENTCFYRLKFTQDRFAWITDAWLVGQNRRLEQTDLIRLNNFNPRWMLNSGNPSSYLPIGKDVIGFWPTPAADGNIVDLTCVMIPDRYTRDTDRIKIKDDFKWACIHLAVSEFYASRGDAKNANYHLAKYVEKLNIRSLYPMAAERLHYYRTTKEPWPKATG